MVTEKTPPPESRISSIFLIIILTVLVLSVSALYLGLDQITADPQNAQGGSFALIGIIGLALSAYMLFQTRRKPLPTAFKIQRVITTILCQACGFKNVRDFQQGDYVFKETESCPKCNKKMMISAIYREVPEKEKGR